MGASDFTVVGGGIGGLVTARRLALAGCAVTVVEASDRLGGTVATHTVGGIDLDAGAESFAVRGGTVAALATELGLGTEIVPPSPAGAWLQPASGAPLPLPATSMLGIPGTPLAADVIAVIGLRAALRAQLDAVIPSLWAGRAMTLGTLVRRRMGDAVLEKLVAPVVHGVHSRHPDDLQLDRAAPGLRRALAREGSLASAVRYLRDAAPAGSAVAGIRGGVYRLVTELAADLDTLGADVQFGRRVTSVDNLDGTVILAAPLTQPTGRTIVLATLVVDVPELDSAPRGTGMLVAEGTHGIEARALTHSTAKWSWLAERSRGLHVLRLSYNVVPDDLAGTARADAAAMLGVPIPAGSVVDFARAAWLRPDAPTAAAAPEVASAEVGERVAGSGLAGIVAHAEATAMGLLAR